MAPKDDNTLVAAYRSGDAEALNTLIERHLKNVYNFVYRMMRNAQDAEDVTQEVFYKMWKHFGSYREDGNFRAWMLQIAYRTAIDVIRKRRSIVFSDVGSEDEGSYGETIEDTGLLPDELAARAGDKAVLEEALEKLREPYREVLLLRYQEDLTFDEIGRVVGRPLDTVKSQHRRALAALREHLKRDK